MELTSWLNVFFNPFHNSLFISIINKRVFPLLQLRREVELQACAEHQVVVGHRPLLPPLPPHHHLLLGSGGEGERGRGGEGERERGGEGERGRGGGGEGERGRGGEGERGRGGEEGRNEQHQMKSHSGRYLCRATILAGTTLTHTPRFMRERDLGQ